MAGYRMLHPPPKPRLTGALAPAGRREGESCWSQLVLGRRLPQEDAADARVKVRRSADWERINVERSLLKPGRVIGDERERTETHVAALNQNSA